MDNGNHRAPKLIKTGLPDPASYPNVDMSRLDVQHLAEHSIKSLEERDYDSWQMLLAPMHPGDQRLLESNFLAHGRDVASYKVDKIEARNVKIEWHYNGQKKKQYG